MNSIKTKVSDYSARIKKWILPKAGKEASREIDILNINTIYYISFIVCIIQTVTLIIYLFSHLNELDDNNIIYSLVLRKPSA